MFDQPYSRYESDNSGSNSGLELSRELSSFAYSSLSKTSAEHAIPNAQYARPFSGEVLDFDDESDADKQPGVEPQKKMSNKELEKRIAETSDKRDAGSIEETKAMYRELIDRADQAVPDKTFAESMAAIDLMRKALFSDRDLKEGKNGVKELSNQPLSLDRRWKLHVAIVSDMESLGQQVEKRLEFSSYLNSVNQPDVARQIGREAASKADRLVKPVRVNGQQISPIGLFQQESARLLIDRKQLSSPEKQKEAQQASEDLIRLIDTVLRARKL